MTVTNCVFCLYIDHPQETLMIMIMMMIIIIIIIIIIIKLIGINNKVIAFTKKAMNYWRTRMRLTYSMEQSPS